VGETSIALTFPYVRMNGVLMGDRIVEWKGEMSVIDQANDIQVHTQLEAVMRKSVGDYQL